MQTFRHPIIGFLCMIIGVRAVVDDGAHSFYLLIDDVFEFSRGAKDIVVMSLEVHLLALAHLSDGIKKFSSVHTSFMIK